MKKLFAALLALLVLSGCTQTPPPADSPSPSPTYPAITPMDTEGVTLDSAEYNGIKVSFPAEDWLFDSSLNSLSLYAVEALGTNQTYNVNVQAVAAEGLTIDEDGMEQLMAEMGQYEGYITIDEYGLYDLYDTRVILMESTIKFTEAYIDEMIELSVFTEEQIADLGGREALLAIPPTSQITLYAILDGNMYIYVGTYYSQEQRQAVLDCITVLVATTEKV